MATVTPFDTLAASRKLKAAGFAPEQAEAAAEAIGDAVIGGNIVTKADLRAELANLRMQMLAAHLATVLAILGAIKFLL